MLEEEQAHPVSYQLPNLLGLPSLRPKKELRKKLNAHEGKMKSFAY